MVGRSDRQPRESGGGPPGSPDRIGGSTASTAEDSNEELRAVTQLASQDGVSFGLVGKVVVITGASSGLGAGFALAFAAAGCHLVLAARRRDRLEQVADAARSVGAEVVDLQADVAVANDCDQIAASAVHNYGRLDVLINNAGVGTAVPALKESPDEFRRVIDINLQGTYFTAQSCATVMRPGASIVNIASVLGLIPSVLPQAAYVSSKTAVVGLTRNLARDWTASRGIRVNALAPGYFTTEMTGDVLPVRVSELLNRSCPMKRLGRQAELDAAAMFLAGDRSSYITGAVVPVDGGLSVPYM